MKAGLGGCAAYTHTTQSAPFVARWGDFGGDYCPTPVLSDAKASLNVFVKVYWIQLEALLLEELEVEATAVPAVPEKLTDFRMWGMRKGSLDNWCTSIRSSLR